MEIIFTLGVRHVYHGILEPTCHAKPLLSVILTSIFEDVGRTIKDRLAPGKVEAMVLDIGKPLGFMPRLA